MYFPYLHGKRHELLAVSTMTTAGRPFELLCPVIEPVNANLAELTKCLTVSAAAGLRTAVVCNPSKGDFRNGASHGVLRAAIAGILPNAPRLLPCLETDAALTVASVNGFIKWAGGGPIGIVHRGALPAATLTHLLKSNVVLHVVMPGVPAALSAALPANQRVMIENAFVREDRNSDYGASRFFSNAWRTVLPHNFGVGDYLCIGADFSDGGGPAIAVAIHALFKEKNGDLWLEHFLSDDQAFAGDNTGGKFLEAARKLVAAVAARPSQFGSNPGLDEFRNVVARNHNPGLGKSKEWQMVHHMCLTLDVMTGVL